MEAGRFQRLHEPRRKAVGDAVLLPERAPLAAWGEGLHLRQRLLPADLGQSEAAGEGIECLAEPFKEADDVRVRLVEPLDLHVEGAGDLLDRHAAGRIVVQQRIMHRETDGIEPEPVHAALQPEPRERHL